MKRFAVCALLGSLALAAPAYATPMVAGTSLSAGVQHTLTDQLRVVRARRPDVVDHVNDLAGLRPAVYGATRGRRPAVARELVALGPDALYPMLHVLAVAGYPRALDGDEREALEQGLLQAVGALRDRRAEPVLRAAYETLASPESRVAAARALGALCGPGEIALLAADARVAGARQTAALEGLGSCRALAAVRPLVAALDGATDDAVVAAAARGLANAGSSWATAASHATDDVSRTSAEALVRAYARLTSPAARAALQIAVLAVGHADTPRMIDDAARGASPETRAALVALANLARRR